MKSVCLAILNYNGMHHLQHLLPSLEVACEKIGNKTDVVVLDNLSTDNDVEWVRDNHPKVQCVVAPENDYLFSYNKFIEGVDHDVVVILNNDIKVSESFLQPLLDCLEQADVFAASSCIFDWEGKEITNGPSDLTVNNGMYDWRFDRTRQNACHTLFTSGACMAVDRPKFISLGGFCRLFYPGYCEDLDVCFRAWQEGWRSIYEPASIVWHREHASWSVSEVSSTDILNLKHSLLFQWSSLPMGRGRLTRWFTISKILCGELLKWRFEWGKALVKARIDWTLSARDYRQRKLSEGELEKILEMVRSDLPEVKLES